MRNPILVSLFAIGACVMASTATYAAARCGPHKDPASDKAFEVIEICSKMDAVIKKDPFTIPTELIAGVFVPGALLWTPANASAQFKIPDDPQYKNHVICRMVQVVLSEIPGQGNYLRAGWLRPTSERAAWFKLWMKERGVRQGRTSYHADAYFAFLPKAKLDEARTKGVCMTQQQLNVFPVNR